MAVSDENWRRTGELTPDFSFGLLGGGTWSSRSLPGGRFTLLTVYRGKWCGQCRKQLSALDALVDEFAERDVAVVAVSADTEERAAEFVNSLDLSRLAVGYEMPLDAARQLGVFVSARAKPVEMPLFCEPASFLIGTDQRVFSAWIASCAYARTEPRGILEYVDFIGERTDRTPRGSA